MEWLQLPHWLMIAGTLLVIAGLIRLVISRRQQAKVQDDPANEPSPEPRPQLPPLPDLLDSRPRKSRRLRYRIGVMQALNRHHVRELAGQSTLNRS